MVECCIHVSIYSLHQGNWVLPEGELGEGPDALSLPERAFTSESAPLGK